MEGKAVAPLELGEASLLQLHVIIGIKAVDPDDLLSPREQVLDDMKPDKSGRAGDQNHSNPHKRGASIAKQPANQSNFLCHHGPPATVPIAPAEGPRPLLRLPFLPRPSIAAGRLTH